MTRSHPSRSGDSPRSKRPDKFPVPNVPGGYNGPQGYPTSYPTHTPSQKPKQQPASYDYPQIPPHPHQLPVPQINPTGGHASAISQVHVPNDYTRLSSPDFPHAVPDGRVPDRAPPSSYLFGAPPHPHQSLAPQVNPTGGHASAISQVHAPNDYTRLSSPEFPYAFPDGRAPGRAPPPSYLFGAPGRPSVPQPPNPPIQSRSRYETVSSHASGSRLQGRPPDYSPSPNIFATRNPPSWPSPTPVQPPAQPPYGAGRGHQIHRPHLQAVRPYLRVGQKKAVLVGINYSGHPDREFRLEWGVFDACEMARFLHKSCGFEWSNMQILTDNQPGSLPTKANICAAMCWLVKDAQPDDTLFFYFSGHATQVKDLDGDDSDGLDECMCAMDYMCDVRSLPSPDTPGIIVDDDINRIMVQPLPQGCRLTAVLDCCHSGTLLDLPFIYDTRGRLESSYDPNVIQQKSSLADVISLSACMDRENAFEVSAEGGALRKAFIEYMTSAGSRGSCYDVIRSLLDYMLARGLRQQPQLSSSHAIDICQRFTIV